MVSTLTVRSKTLWTLGFAFMVVLYILSAGGCDLANKDVVREVDEKEYIHAQEELRKGNVKEALSGFLKVTEKRVDAAESHLELGGIYLKEDNPIRAIYHFEKYLELMPNSQSSPMVKQMILTSQKRFVASLPETPFEDRASKIELEDVVLKLQKENLDLKQKLNKAILRADKLEASQRVTVAKNTPTQTVRPVAAVSEQRTERKVAKRGTPRDIPSTYTVQPGDTLSSVSRKVYGTPNRWREIFKANRDRLSTPESLRQGQILRIPR